LTFAPVNGLLVWLWAAADPAPSTTAIIAAVASVVIFLTVIFISFCRGA
jgi:hypothetical protein